MRVALKMSGLKADSLLPAPAIRINPMMTTSMPMASMM